MSDLPTYQSSKTLITNHNKIYCLFASILSVETDMYYDSLIRLQTCKKKQIQAKTQVAINTRLNLLASNKTQQDLPYKSNLLQKTASLTLQSNLLA